ncbi:hypothetical protein ACQWKP_23955, partial [Salmonella enterica subsp. enterica serovar Infantis]
DPAPTAPYPGAYPLALPAALPLSRAARALPGDDPRKAAVEAAIARAKARKDRKSGGEGKSERTCGELGGRRRMNKGGGG